MDIMEPLNNFILQREGLLIQGYPLGRVLAMHVGMKLALQFHIKINGVSV